jgi:flagellar hook-basal body complex protein FliE
MIPLVAPLGAKIVEGIGDSTATFLGNTAQPSGGIAASFSAMLGNAATRVVGNLEQAEQVSAKALQGEGDMRSVVDAVMTADQSLQAAVAIRDKIVSAYLEISRMAI